MRNQVRNNNARRGTVVVFTAVSMAMIIGFAALAIDVGYAYSVKAELQRNADAAALAGTTILTYEQMLDAAYDPTNDAITAAQETALQNYTGGIVTPIASVDIKVGYLSDPTDPTEVLDVGVTPNTYNAVQVVVRRQDSLNGEIPMFFASILGVDSMPLQATATAAVEDGFAGFRPPSSGTNPLIPFTVDLAKFTAEIINGGGNDFWSWNSATQTPENVPDGNPEIWIFPLGVDAAGNFGTLNIGVGNLGATELGGQIENGISEADLISEIGTANLVFTDSDGDPITYTITGNTGITAGIISYVNTRVGDVVAFFLYSSVSDVGANAEFQIVDLRFARLLEVELTGAPANKRIVLQPTSYNGPGIQTGSGVGNGNGMFVFSQRLIR